MSRTFEVKGGEDSYFVYHNPYYDPEKCGLEIVVNISKDISYEFDMVIVWKDVETGKLYMGHDSGCSCPTPFENFKSLDDMTEITNIKEYRAFFENLYFEGMETEIHNAEVEIKKLLK